MAPTEIWIRLMSVNGLYGERMREAAEKLISLAAAGKLVPENAPLTAKQFAQFMAFPESSVEKTLRWLDARDRHLLLATDPLYPESLRAIVDYPAALFVAGPPALLSSQQLAVVGSRNHSWYGERWGRVFCETLARHQLTITSGLARGIDSVAHRAALAVGGKTVAVLGNGLFHHYPRCHASLAQHILDSGGALVSEFPLDQPPRAPHFPRRNRIISGLSRGVLVVEAAIKSGSLVTARIAAEQGREVYAIPGPLGNPGCEGPHWLIKQGATPVTSAEEILESLQYGLRWLPDRTEFSNYSIDTEEVALPFPALLANVGDEVTPVDVVAERAGQPVPETVAQLLELELAGWIAAVPGGYVRLRRACHVRRTHVFV
ncbi:DNA-protecting protein DprA [[Enterobacter] lignolyticus]|uniref:DNA processing protein DprA n=1 Tax=[Enterobacter] lignolyticus TaxID=1334193 RepID=A0A806XI10_9ENTR|nr:DNA-protecting protein DprA [[Enterobacter] lignolyticus]ALR78339.1 DNA processing protein DprA [[Enterobacter] lignolyticus]